MKLVEGAGDDEVGEAVIDDEYFDATLGGLVQSFLEPLPGRVRFPNEGFKENMLLGAADGGQHVGVEVLTVGVDLRLGFLDGGIEDSRAWESDALAPLAAFHRIEDHQTSNNRGLYGHESQSQSGGRFFQARHHGGWYHRRHDASLVRCHRQRPYDSLTPKDRPGALSMEAPQPVN